MLVNKGFQFSKYIIVKLEFGKRTFKVSNDIKFFHKIHKISEIDTLLKNKIQIEIHHIISDNNTERLTYLLEFDKTDLINNKRKLEQDNTYSDVMTESIEMYIKYAEEQLKQFLGHFLDFMFEVFPTYQFTEREIEYLKEYQPNHLIWLYEKPKDPTVELNSTNQKQLSPTDKLNQLHADFTFLRAQQEWNSNSKSQ